MDGSITITIGDLLLFILGIGGIVLIVFLAILLKNLIDTVKNATAAIKNANIVLTDLAVVSDIASNRAQDVDAIVEGVTTSVGTIAENLKGNLGLVKTITSLVSLLTTLMGLFSKKTNESKTEANADDENKTEKSHVKHRFGGKKK